MNLYPNWFKGPYLIFGGGSVLKDYLSLLINPKLFHVDALIPTQTLSHSFCFLTILRPRITLIWCYQVINVLFVSWYINFDIKPSSILDLVCQTHEFPAISILTPKHIHKHNLCPFIFIRLSTFATMSGSMSLEEKFEAPMKSYQIIVTSNQQLKHRLNESEGQNAYLRKQLGESMKLSTSWFKALLDPFKVKEEKLKVSQENYWVKKKPPDAPRENKDLLFPTLMTLKLRYLNLKGNSILMSFLSGYI